MGELFQGRERFFVGEVENVLMQGDDLEIEGGNLIEEVFCGCKIRGVSRLIAQCLSDCFGRLRHETVRSFFSSSLSFSFCARGKR